MIGLDEAARGGFLSRHTRVGKPLIADENVVTVCIGFEYKTRNGRDHCAETQLACAQRLLNLLTFMNIDARTDIAEKVAAGRETGDTLIQYPAVLAIIAS